MILPPEKSSVAAGGRMERKERLTLLLDLLLSALLALMACMQLWSGLMGFGPLTLALGALIFTAVLVLLRCGRK